MISSVFVVHLDAFEENMFGVKKYIRRVVQYSILGLCLSAVLTSCGDPVGGVGTSPVFLSVYQTAEEDSAIEADVSELIAVKADITVVSTYRDPSGTTATDLANVYLTQQVVTYYRSDGNTDVPDPFETTINYLVPAGGELEAEIIILRADAKVKSPLEELELGGGEGIIYLNAYVQFYGEDLAGNSISTEVTIPFSAADYEDE